MRIVRSLLVVLAALAVAPASARADEGDIIVRHAPRADAAKRAEARRQSGTALERRLRLGHTEVVRVAQGTRSRALARLRADADVLWAEPDRPVRTLTTDPYFHHQWALFNDGAAGRRIDADVDAQQAWGAALGTGVTVAVVDTGVDATHPDLAGRLVAGWNFVSGDANTADTGWHGTHVAGIIAANRGNGIGVAGIAPAAKVMPLQVFDANGDAWLSDVADAFDYAGSHGVPIVNASLGGSGGPSPTLEAIYAAHPDTLYVVAAGNDGSDNDASPTWPCVSTAPNLLCVGASDDTDRPADFSNRGAGTVDLFAPGVDVLSTYPGAQFAWADGTSMASPFAAGAAALVHEKKGLKGAALAQQLKATVDRPAALAGTSVTGGRLNAARAVGAPVDAPTAPVVAAAHGGPATATLTMAEREADIDVFSVRDANGSVVAITHSATATVAGLPPGAHTFTVVAHNTSGMASPASQPATVTVTTSSPAQPAPAPPATTPTPPEATPPTAPPPATKPAAPVTGLRVVTRRGRRSLVFRVTRTTRVTVTLSKLTKGRYRRTASRTVRMAAGLQSLPLTSRLLGMKVARGRFKVTVGRGTASASVSFTRR